MIAQCRKCQKVSKDKEESELIALGWVETLNWDSPSPLWDCPDCPIAPDVNKEMMVRLRTKILFFVISTALFIGWFIFLLWLLWNGRV